MTVRLAGCSFVFRIESESQMVTSSNGMVSGRRGRDPVAITIDDPRSRTALPSGHATLSVWGSTKEARPGMIATWLRCNWSVTTATSLLMT